MSGKKLHPSVEKFKEFVKSNPKIIHEVRNGNASWQELYEDWYLLGEDDTRWEEFKSTRKEKTESSSSTKKTEWMAHVMDSIKKMDPNQVQGYINNISQALAAFQGVFSQFQGGGGPSSTSNKVEKKPTGPFSFKKD